MEVRAEDRAPEGDDAEDLCPETVALRTQRFHDERQSEQAPELHEQLGHRDHEVVRHEVPDTAFACVGHAFGHCSTGPVRGPLWPRGHGRRLAGAGRRTCNASPAAM